MADRIVRAKALPTAIRKSGAGPRGFDELCSHCFAPINTQHNGNDYRVASFRNPNRNLTIHLFARGAPLCVDCVVEMLEPYAKRKK